MWQEWGRIGMHIGFWWESQKERDLLYEEVMKLLQNLDIPIWELN
jgi:transcriptional antiterminator